jgi:predicted phosphate transport protein (TIGR00153 family)
LYNKIQSLEHQGDEITHTIINQLNKTFITPFDREDIYNLTKELDDVIDMLNTITNRIRVYKITVVNPTLVEFSTVILDSVKAVQSAIKCMRNVKQHESIMCSCVEINRLENVGDTMRDRALGSLFDNEKDPITIIKWKEIYTDAETILDICEDVAHIIETILVKQA